MIGVMVWWGAKMRAWSMQLANERIGKKEQEGQEMADYWAFLERVRGGLITYYYRKKKKTQKHVWNRESEGEKGSGRPTTGIGVDDHLEGAEKERDKNSGRGRGGREGERPVYDRGWIGIYMAF